MRYLLNPRTGLFATALLAAALMPRPQSVAPEVPSEQLTSLTASAARPAETTADAIAASAAPTPNARAPLALATDVGMRLGRGWRGPDFHTLLAELNVGDAALEAAADALAMDNADTDTVALRQRMALIDLLGVAAKSNVTARTRLVAYALSPLDTDKEPSLLHLDVTDRLEAFVYVAALAPDVATRHIRRLPGKGFKSRYVTQFVAGREYAGLSRREAVDAAYDAFARDADLAFALQPSEMP